MDDAAFDVLLHQAYRGETGAVLAALDLDPTLATRARNFGYTLLHFASMGNQLELGRALLDRGSDVHARNDKGWDALYCAYDRGSNLAIVTLLLDRGADPCSADNRGYTVLMDSAIHSDHQVCLLLVHRGADLLAVWEGQTALDLYGFDTNLAAAEKEERCAALRAAFAEGPHPSQVQRRKDERFARRWPLMQVLTGHDFLPLAARRAVLAVLHPALPPWAAIPPLPNRTRAQRYALLRNKVLSHAGIVKIVASFL
jgi:hypothetical protein